MFTARVVPSSWHEIKDEVDLEEVKKVFPYGQLLPVELQRGGMRASSGIELSEMGGEVLRVRCSRHSLRYEFCSTYLDELVYQHRFRRSISIQHYSSQ